jgi:1,4-alpha-glucan branching enzyme
MELRRRGTGTCWSARSTRASSRSSPTSTGSTAICRPLHEIDFDSSGFEWIDCHDSQPVGAELPAQVQADGKQIVACAFNFTPVPRENYRIGVPKPGFYREAINSDAELYGGSNVGNRGGVTPSR